MTSALTPVLQIAASFLGPFMALWIATKIEPRKSQRQQRVMSLRILLSLRHQPADPTYQTAINLIPIDFKGDERVLAAHRAYLKAANQQGGEPAVVGTTTAEKLKNLIAAMAEALDYAIGEEQIEQSYQTTAHANQVALQNDAQKAWIRIADALEEQNRMMRPEGTA